MDPEELAPWPIVTGCYAFAAAAAWFAATAAYDVAAVVGWATAAGTGWAATHMLAEHAVYRISTRRAPQATGPAPHPNCRCTPAQTTGDNQ